MNYDASQVGVPFVRAYGIHIAYPDAGVHPAVVIEQGLAVLLADGAVRKIGDLNPINVSVNFALHGDDPVPMVHPETGIPLGMDTSLNQAFLTILAIVRSEQLKVQ